MENLEAVLFQLYNKRIRISLGGKDLKIGKLHPCIYQPLFVELYIEKVIGKKDKLKIPYPFLIEEHLCDGLVYLDYRLSTFNINTRSDFDVDDVSHFITHKYFDKILTLEVDCNE